MTKVLNFDSFLAKVAKNNYKLHIYSTEWKIAIFITFFAKLFTMLAGVYAGYYFLFDTLINAVEAKYAIFAAVFILVVVEVLNNIFLSKFFKFALRFKTHYLTAGALLLVVFFLFAGSFYISTNGLAAKQAQKADKTAVYVSNETDLKQSIESNYLALINGLKSEIQTIKNNPRGAGGSLTMYQQKNIAEYNKQILALLSQKQSELSELKASTKKDIATNQTTVKSEARRFYTLMEVVMLVQLFCNAFLMFSWSRIFNETDKNEALNESVNNTVTNIQSFINSAFNSELKQQQTILANALNYANSQYIQPAPGTNQRTNEQPAPVQKNSIGFIKPQPNNENRNNENRNNENKPTCKHCNTAYVKNHHKQIYCCETCRISAYELRTGAKFTKKQAK